MGILTNLARGASAALIAKKASSDAAFFNGAQLASHSGSTIEKYFDKYGSTAKKFEYNEVGNFYFGYVITPERGEFLSVIIMDSAGCVASSFLPPMDFGNDILSLIGKKEFADQVALTFVQAAQSV